MNNLLGNHAQTIYGTVPVKATVYLVGAGPGDPGLITLKAFSLLQSADVIIYDRLVNNRLVACAKENAELIPVGKHPGGKGVSQSDINSTLMRKALEGKSVVRLKGGDPFLFGRGGEEAEILAESGIKFEIVPGVTSAIAVPAYSGIPLTQRGLSSLITITTGSESPEKSESTVSWDALAGLDGTIVVLMGWEALPSIVKSLISNGLEPDTPIALIQMGTTPNQKTVVSTLANIERDSVESGLAPPVVTIIGKTVTMQDKLRWFENRPLFGKRILVTRTGIQAAELSQLFMQEGGNPIEIPTIEIEALDNNSELDQTLSKISVYDWVIFASTNVVEMVFGRLEVLGLDARALYGTKVAAVGPTTEQALKSRGIVADFTPDRIVSDAIVDGLSAQGMAGKTVLLPRSNIGREALPNGLEKLGAIVTQVAAYRNVIPESNRDRLYSALEVGIDVATFTSASTVNHFVTLLNGDISKLNSTTIACIGPSTAAAARESGLTVHIEADEYTIEGLVQSVVDHFLTIGQDR